MPFSDYFAPDINFVSARSVYPTSRGGSTASASGAMSGSTNTMTPDPVTGAGTPTVAATAQQPVNMSGNTVWWWVGVLVLLLVMVFVARKAGGAENFRNINPTFYNFMAITLTAIVGIVGMKTIFTKYRVPGLSDVVLAA